MFPAWNASNIDAEIHGLLFAMLGQFLTLARWIFTDNVLPSFESPASDRFSAAIVLAANIAVAAATALLELTTVLDFPGEGSLIQSKNMWTLERRTLEPKREDTVMFQTLRSKKSA